MSGALLSLTLVACAPGAAKRTPTPTFSPPIYTAAATATPSPISTFAAPPGSMPAVSGTLYAVTGDHTLAALSPSDGTTRWQ